ncbi:MAG: winged helix-turn-helix domain-containing protein, partial [Paraglaciecola sp.]|nr:winged helix-turn-helix domain-containing protein [Paraglaciecola sp.]
MIYKFEDFELDSTNFRLSKNGNELAIEPQVFNLMAYLLANRERLVTRDEVFKNLWAGREVLDASLSNHIKSARSVLGDDGETQCFIKTYRSRGYQFVADVEVFEKTNVKIETNNTSKPSVRTASRWMKIGGIVTVFCGLLIFSYWQSITKGDKE